MGRLDKDSEGLLLMTNDGAFANAMMHPSGGISKLYRVTVQPRAREEQILKLSSGVVLDDGTKTMPCTINVVVDEPGRTVMEITLKEGKNREIRRMCEAVGLEVVRLKRNAEGGGQAGDAAARQVPGADQTGAGRPAGRCRQGPRPDPQRRRCRQGCPPSGSCLRQGCRPRQGPWPARGAGDPSARGDLRPDEAHLPARTCFGLYGASGKISVHRAQMYL